MAESFLPRPEVQRRVGLSRSTLYELIRQGEFPRPIRLTKNRVAWQESKIDQWIEARICASEEAA